MTVPADTLERAVEPLLRWFDREARPLPWRDDPSPYRVWVSEVMLQQTRIEAVKPYFARFMEALPTVEALAQAEEEQVLKLWEGLGYYSRARNLHKAAKAVVENFHGQVPGTVKGLLTLPGVGAYTAGAVASIAFGEKAPAVDGNVLRVVSRLLCREDDVGSPAVKKRVESEILAILPEGRAGAFNQAIMELGEVVCVPGTPRCGDCPLEGLCEARQLGVEASLPVKGQKKPRRVEARTVFVLSCGERLALRKRPDSGLLAGMWELPSVQGHLGEAEARQILEQWGIAAVQLRRLEDSRHIFSHLEWQMWNWDVQAAQRAPGFVWATAAQLREEYALPSAFDGVLKGAWDLTT